MRVFPHLTSILSFWLIGSTIAFGAEDALFERGVEQIVRAKCLRCHGADKRKRKAELDLSRVSKILKGGESGPAIVPGNLDDSLLWEQVSSGAMPPEEKESLTKAELEVIKLWILGGAKTRRQEEANSVELNARKFWSFQKLQRPQPPQVHPADRAATDIDRFVLSALKKRGLSFSAPADRRTLIRRLSLDLTGLPPTSEQINDFVAEKSPNAYENLVDRILDSPHYGEHWGQHWLDVAGYSDSNGYHRADSPRPLAYRYRDYVIKSFNDDKPYDQFWLEQLAGDELVDFPNIKEFTPEIIEKLVATHFLRNGPDGTDSTEGNEIARTIERYAVLEQMQQITISAMFALTINCARCHSHKFDPISQSEYYGLQALFFPAFNVKKWVPPKQRTIHAASSHQLAQWKAQSTQIDSDIAGLQLQFSKWVRQHRPQSEVVFEDGFDDRSAKLAAHWSNTAPGDDAPAGTTGVNVDAAKAPAARIETQSLQVIAAGSSHNGWLATRRKFDWTPERTGDWIQASFDLVNNKLKPGGTAAERIGYYIALHDDNDNSPIAGGNILIDGNPAGGAGVHVDYPGKDGRGVGQIGQSKYLPGRSYGVRVKNVGGGKFRLEHLVDWFPEEKSIVLNAKDLPDGAFGFEFCCGRSFIVDNVTVEQGSLQNSSPTAKSSPSDFVEKVKQKRQELEKQIKAKNAQRPPRPGRIAWVTDLSPTAPKVPLLKRGRYFSHGPDVTPTALSILSEPGHQLEVKPPFASAKTTGRRLAFARWATKPGSRAAALLARVQVNRVWMWHFGAGLVETPENFGNRGTKPSHPKLLEWLAAEFVKSGWNTKHLHRLIVKSNTYRQAGGSNSKAVEIDPQNRLLWSFPVRRLESETIRDSMLAVAGTLNRQLGGPPVDYKRNAEGQVQVIPQTDLPTAAENRRSVYLRHRRSEPITFLATFDQASPEPNCLRRATSTVVSQSLAMLNGRFAVRTAEAFAKRVEHLAGKDQRKQVQSAFQLAFGRLPGESEFHRTEAFLSMQIEQHIKNGAKDKTNAEHRALIDLCQVLFASNEFLYLQ